MKTQLVVVIYVIFIFGCRQCVADGFNFDTSWYDGQPDPSGLFAGGVSSPGVGEPSPFFAPRFGGTGPLDAPGTYVAHASDSSASAAASAAQSSVAVSASPYGEPNPLAGVIYGAEEFFNTASSTAGKIGGPIFNIIKKLLRIPIVIIKIFLLPVTITFRIARFFIRLIFLPVRIVWGIIKFFTFPFRWFIRKVLFPTPPPPPPFVVGVPAGPGYPGQPIYS